MDKLSNFTKPGSSYAGGSGSVSGPTLSESSRAAIKGTRWEAMDNEIDSNLGNKHSFVFHLSVSHSFNSILKCRMNLDSMSSQLSRLRVLGAAIGEEVDSQNEMLDRIHVKVERTNARVKDQDKQVYVLHRHEISFLLHFKKTFTFH